MAIRRGVSIRPAVQDDTPPLADDPRRISARDGEGEGDGQPPQPAHEPAAVGAGAGEGDGGAPAGAALADPPASPRPARSSSRRAKQRTAQPDPPQQATAREEPDTDEYAEEATEPAAGPAAAGVYGERVQRSVMMPAQLWMDYRALADELSTPRRRVSGNDLVLAVVLVHTPDTVTDAERLTVAWEDLLATDDGQGYGVAVQRPVRLYESQMEHLNQLDRALSLRRIKGARSKVICGVLHFHRPADHDEARALLAAVRAAERAAPVRTAA